MRDLERIREKTALYLDGRQVFGMFFGSAIVATGIFAAGVWVGNNLVGSGVGEYEADPLALIDQMGAEEEASLSFEQKIPQNQPTSTRTFPKEESTALALLAPDKASEAEQQPDAVPVPESPTENPAPAPPKTKQLPNKKALARKASASAERPGKFTLQLSSFQERSEADAFANALTEKGYQSNVVTSEVPGKGLWYRVRMGEYASRQEALEAKYAFERKEQVIAYVTPK